MTHTKDEALKSARETLTFCLPNDLDRVDEIIAALVTPPAAAQRTWVGLTKADINEIWKGEPMLLPWDMTRTLAIEQRLKEKNND